MSGIDLRPGPFPERCPDCGAPLLDESWRDPITLIDHPRHVRHRAGCVIYRARAYDRTEGVAHMLDLGPGPASWPPVEPDAEPGPAAGQEAAT